MYAITDYGRMIADPVRVGAYTEALRRAVRPGDIVVELGTGLGSFALLCCEIGARKVIAIEPDRVIDVAREIVEASPFRDRVVLMQAMSTEVTLDEPADVLVSDLRGVLPMLTKHIPSVADARARLLKPGGVQIPMRDTLWAAPVSAADEYARLVGPFEENPFGHDMTAARNMVLQDFTLVRFAPEQLVGQPARWATLDYTTETTAAVAGTIAVKAERRGPAHGLLAWFDAELLDGVGFSNAPGAPPAVYKSAFFPWLEPVMLEAGDVVEAAIRADPVAGNYVWTWRTTVAHAGGRQTHFDQSTFNAVPMTRARLAARASGAVTVLDERGQIEAFVLGAFDGRRTNREVADAVCERFPHRFASAADALAYVGDLAVKHSR